MSIRDIPNAVIGEIRSDYQLMLQRSNTVAAAAERRGAGAFLQKAVAASVMPLAAVSVAFQRLGAAILFTAVTILKQGGRLIGLDSQTIDNLALQMQAWRIVKALGLSSDNVVVKAADIVDETPEVVTQATAGTFEETKPWYSKAWDETRKVAKGVYIDRDPDAIRKANIAIHVAMGLLSVGLLVICAVWEKVESGRREEQREPVKEQCPAVSPDMLKGMTSVGQLITIDPQCPQQAWSVLMPGKEMSELRNEGTARDISRSFRKLTLFAHPDKISEGDKQAYPDHWQGAQRNLVTARDSLQYCLKNVELCLKNIKVTDAMRSTI